MIAEANVIMRIALREGGFSFGNAFFVNKPSLAVKRVNFVGQGEAGEFASRICPSIILRRANNERARNGECKQEMLIEGERGFIIRILSVGRAEPIRELIDYLRYRLTNGRTGYCIA